ncbi:MAG: 5-carboxymethyl-2-hydroxymuconate Delta-isomerase [Candidatus Odinarchaeota archaeon]
MPQIILEYSSNIKENVDFRKLFSDIHHIIETTGGVKIENCKSRAKCQDDYFIGTGKTDSAFIHLEIQWIEGRTEEVKTQLGRDLLNLLKGNYISSLETLGIQITVHLIDIAKNSYFKYPGGTLTVQ